MLLGLSVGVGLFALAGARRTQSSYDHFLSTVRSSDAAISGIDPADNAHVAGLSGVVGSRTYLGMRAVVLVGGTADLSQFFEAAASYDGAFFDQDRFVATTGRVPDRNRADEIAVNEDAAARYGYRVGQVLDIGVVDPAILDDPQAVDPYGSFLHRSTMTIVGIGLFPDEVMEDDADRTPRTLFTPAFAAIASDAAFYNLQYLRLANGDSDLDAVTDYLSAVSKAGSVDVHYVSVDRAHARRGLRPLSITLAVFGLVVAFVAALLGVVALIRLQRREAHEAEVLTSLGASPAAIRSSALVAPAITLLGACVVTGLTAVMLSPLMPLGPVHGLGSSAGFDIDPETIGLGLLAVVVVWSAGLALSVRRSAPLASRRTTRYRRSRLVQRAASAGAPPSFVTGVRMTVDDGAGPGGVPMRYLIGSTALAAALLVVALGFATNLRGLTQHPEVYGWNWDVALRGGQGFGGLDAALTATILDADEDVGSWSTAYLGDDLLDGIDVPLLGMTPSTEVRPPVVSGRFIASADEIVLGASTASTIHAGIGDTVSIGTGGSARELHVVGIGVLPAIGRVHVQHPALGLGAIVAPELMPGVGDPTTAPGPALAFIEFRHGVDPAAATTRLAAATAPLGDVSDLDLLPAQRPSEIVNTSSIGAAPLVVAASLAAVAALALGFALVASVRRNQRDLAVLRTLGFEDRQMVSTIVWHAYTILGCGLIVGLPVGVVASSWLWRAFADELDVVGTNRSSSVAVALVAAGAIAVVTLISIAPAFAARRLATSTILHAT